MLVLRLSNTILNKGAERRVHVGLLHSELRCREVTGEDWSAGEYIEKPPRIGVFPCRQPLIPTCAYLIDVFHSLTSVVDSTKRSIRERTNNRVQITGAVGGECSVVSLNVSQQSRGDGNGNIPRDTTVF